MWREVKAEIIELGSNLIFARNLSFTIIIAIAGLYGLAELQSQDTSLTQTNSITNLSNSSSTKIIVELR
ncbi:MAG: hypothetical protein AAFQ14_07705 [Cyanobacteria bacterium J06621_12]